MQMNIAQTNDSVSYSNRKCEIFLKSLQKSKIFWIISNISRVDKQYILF